MDPGLAQRGYAADKAAHRRRYLEHLEEIARETRGVPGVPGGDGRTLQSSLRCGWYFGGEGFREGLLERLSGKASEGAGKKRYRRESGYVGVQMRDCGERAAERIIAKGLSLAGMEADRLEQLAKGDWRKRVIGGVVRSRTTVRVTWIAERLAMGVATRAGGLIRLKPRGRDWGPE